MFILTFKCTFFVFLLFIVSFVEMYCKNAIFVDIAIL